MELTEHQLALWLQSYLLPFTRITTMLMVMPVIGSRIVSPRVRLALALLVTVLVAPLMPPLPQIDPLSMAMMVSVVQEVAIGAVIGFSFQIIFQMFVLSGQYMAMKMGLGFASMNDPTSGVQTTVISQLFLMMVTLMFVSSDGHLLLLTFLVNSFQTLPPGPFHLHSEVFLELTQLGSWLFASALVFALPVLTSLLFVNMAFGVMSRAAPQLNIFAIGFPFTLICGLLLIWLGLTNLPEIFEATMTYGYQVVEQLTRGR